MRHDPSSSHAKTTPIGASKPLRFANTTRTDVIDPLAQQVFCLVIREGFQDPTVICHPEYVETCSTLLPCQDDSNWGIKTTPVSEIRSRFVIRNTSRHDPRSSHAKTTQIGVSKPLRFANTTRTDVFDPLAQQVFCLVIREGFRDPTVSEIRPRFIVWNTLIHDPSSSHANTTPIGASKPLRFANTTRTDVSDPLAQQVSCLVSEIRLRFFVRNTLRHDPRSSHAKTTPIGASKPLRFANTTQTDVFDSLAKQVFCLVSKIRPQFVVQNTLRHDRRYSHAKTTPIGASKPLRFANTTRTDVFDPLAQQVLRLVSEIRLRFFVRNTLRHDPRSSHAKTTPIGASKPFRFANTTRTDVFDSLAQQVFCLVIREGFRYPTAICCPEYVET
ncbi:uncharacterized protein G2W53_010330 [Senna tora]|uniref:Uncharacterized protein n=1 Tax=Senna tora TaxID=362788 RepID=A0A835CB80_9FABA|nr:uncharacterized protein G2W53_010330 [Senna tora]